ncbi:MAG: HAD hydrolase-like protein [Akkermansiaceae bacterium]
MKYRALIFDFDGTIADTLDEALKIYNQMAGEFSLRPVEESELPHLRTMGLSTLLDHLEISKLKVPKLLYRGKKILKARIPQIPMIQGMKEVLIELRNEVEYFGILTSNSVENATLFLEAHGVADLFNFVSSTSKLTGKSRYLKRILKEYELSPEELIYIGDETRDVISAHKAGVSVVAVTFGFNAKMALAAEQPTHLCDSPQELVTVLQS